MRIKKLAVLAGVWALVVVGCTSKPATSSRPGKAPPKPAASDASTVPEPGAEQPTKPEAGSVAEPGPAPAPAREPEPDYSNEPLPEPNVTVDEVREVLAKLQVDGVRDIADVGAELAMMGATGIRHLTAMLKNPGEGADADMRARFALSGLAYHVTREGAGRERNFYARALVRELEREGLTKPVKGFLVRQLRLAGRSESAAALGALLFDEELSEYAAQALVSIGKGSAEEFRKALPAAKGQIRLTAIQALGVLRDRESAKVIAGSAGAADRAVRIAVLGALGSIGDPASETTLLKGLSADGAYEKAKATEAVFRFLDRLLDDGRKDDVARIARGLWEKTTAEEDCHIRCAALQALAAAEGGRAMGELRAAMKSEDMHIRAVATDTAVMLPGEDITRQWIDQLAKAGSASEKVGTLKILARRRDVAALDAVLAAMRDSDQSVQIAAIDAVALIGGKEAVAPLVKSLSAASAGERDAAKTALQRLRGRGVTAAIAASLPAAPDAAKAPILAVLAARGATENIDVIIRATQDADDSVRAAAWSALGTLATADSLGDLIAMLVKADGSKTLRAAEKALGDVCRRAPDREACAGPVVGALAGAGVPAQCALIRALARIGGREALDAVSAAWDSRDEEVKTSAVKTLGEWPTADAAGKLMSITKTAQEATHRVLALRGYVRAIGLPTDRTTDETLALYRDAMGVAKRPDEKKLVLAGLGGVASLEALRMAEKLFKDPALKDEACIAAVSIARAIGSNHGAEARAALDEIVRITSSDHVRNKAREAINHLERFNDYVTTWRVAGPYTKAQAGDKNLFDAELAPEKSPGDVKWISWTGEGDRPYFVDFMRIKGVGGNDRTAYLRAQIYSPKEQDARLELGSDDQVKCWIDDKLVHANPAMRGFKEGEDKPKVRLKRGWNVLLVKIVQGGGDWSTGVRVRALDGSKLEGLRIKAE